MLRQLMERSRLEYPKTSGRNLVDITLGGHESLYPGILGSSWSQGASHRSSADTATLTEAEMKSSYIFCRSFCIIHKLIVYIRYL